MIVVTGGVGFIGSCIVARLNEIGREDLIIVDHLEKMDSKERNIRGKRYADYFDKKDFLDLVLQNRLDDNIDTVIHMGACSSTTLNDAQYYEENNFEYTRHLAQWCLKNNVRFIYASSAATYGDGSQGYMDDEETIRRLKPLNLYGGSKQKFDLWVLGNNVIDKVVGLKFFNVFGPNEYHKGDMRSVIAKAYPKVVKDGKISLFKSYIKEYTDGEQRRDFIYVKDAVDIVMYFFEHTDINGIYNVGTGHARTWNDVASALFKAAGKELSIEYIDMPENLRDKYQYFTEANITNLRGCGYNEDFTPLDDAVKDYARYLSEDSCI